MNEPDHLYEYLAEVIDVYDGDTIRANIDLGFKVWVFDERIRLTGIDAPEMRGETLEAARRSRDFLREQILNKTVMLRTTQDKQEKYGRYLAEVFTWDEAMETWESVNQMLVDHGFAELYQA
jgi:micrococcal nuclease